MKKYAWGLVIIWALTILGAVWWNVAHAQSIQIVDDPFNRLTQTQKTELVDMARVNGERNHVQVVFWLPNLEKSDDINQKAAEYFQQHKIGTKDVDSGLLVVIDWSNRRSRIEVGNGLESIFTDARMKTILADQMAPHFKKGDLFGGLKAGIQALSIYSVTWRMQHSPPADYVSNETTMAGDQPVSAERMLIYMLAIILVGAWFFWLVWYLMKLRATPEFHPNSIEQGVPPYFTKSYDGGLLVGGAAGAAATKRYHAGNRYSDPLTYKSKPVEKKKSRDDNDSGFLTGLATGIVLGSSGGSSSKSSSDDSSYKSSDTNTSWGSSDTGGISSGGGANNDW